MKHNGNADFSSPLSNLSQRAKKRGFWHGWMLLQRIVTKSVNYGSGMHRYCEHSASKLMACYSSKAVREPLSRLVNNELLELLQGAMHLDEEAETRLGRSMLWTCGEF